MKETFQVFISYARKDDIKVGGDPTTLGFVSYLHDRLREQLDSLGASHVDLWIDRDNIADTDRFAPVLEEQIAASSLMLVVMSPNWLQSDYCQREAARFAELWRAKAGDAAVSRLKVIRKLPNDRATWPDVLQGQVGIPFFSGDPNKATGLVNEFFWNGKKRDETYDVKVRELAGVITQEALALPPPPPAPPARTVYLARPARDMAKAHERLVRELVGHDYAVVPDHDIPTDDTAVAFIDEALARASVSIHLVGLQKGFSPQDASPIVNLQLERAALRVAASGAKPLRRIVWAPKLLEKDPPDATPMAERDPLKTLEQFAPRLDSDKIDGQVLSKFVDFLLQNIPDPPPPAPPPAGPNDLPQVYLCHEAGDEDFAGRIADALGERQVQPLLRSFDGEPDEVEALHHRRLRECDAVAVCWAQSPQAKIAMQTNEWKDWRQLQRSRQFAFKALVKGPPLDDRKKRSRFLFPHDEVDLQLELDADLNACSDRIAQLVPRGPGAPA